MFPCSFCYYIIFSVSIKSSLSLSCGDTIVKHRAKCKILWGKTKEANMSFSFSLPDYLILFSLVFLSFHQVMWWPGYHVFSNGFRVDYLICSSRFLTLYRMVLRSRYPSDFKLLSNGRFHGKHSPWWQIGLWLSHVRAFMLYNNQSKGETILVAKNCSSYIYISFLRVFTLDFKKWFYGCTLTSPPGDIGLL